MTTDSAPVVPKFRTIETAQGPRTYAILRHKVTAERWICLPDGRAIPAEIAALGAGPDAWMREIRTKCRTCGERFALPELVGALHCEPCATADLT